MGITDEGRAYPTTTSPSPVDDSGSAFPYYGNPGMSTRDYFAAQIIGAIIITAARDGIELKSADAEAETAYAWADAMVRARRR